MRRPKRVIDKACIGCGYFVRTRRPMRLECCYYPEDECYRGDAVPTYKLADEPDTNQTQGQ